MHPREGWTEDGPPRPGLSRRSFLQTSAGAGLLAGGLGPLLAACSSGGPPAGASGTTAIPLPRPNNPVTWPLFKDNAAIKSGLQPEQGTLKIYNWVAYINQQCLKDFAKKYNVPVPQVTTFNNTDEAMAKLRSGQVSFDVFFPTIDLMGQLVYGKMIQPLNHSYIPNISQAWPDFTNPFYDGKWRYSVPYTMANPWAMLWQPKYKGKVAILNDAREGISLGLMKNGIYNLNTTNPSQINAAGQSLVELAHLTNVHIDNNDYSNVPTGQMWIHHSWSGDMAVASYYMPKGVPVDVVGYWFPPDGKGPVGNDLITVLKGAENPVLAHLFLNYMLDLHTGLTNYTFTGYMQPLKGITPQRLVQEKLLPKSLMSTTVLPSDFRRGVMEVQISVTTNALWEQAGE